MGFGLVTSLAVSTVVVMACGGRMVQAARRAPASPLLRWSAAACLCLGAGFALLLMAPAEGEAPLRLFGNAAPILAYGLFWGAARRCGGRPVPFEAVGAGALAWLLAASFLDPSEGGCFRIASFVAGASCLATAWEHHGGTTAPGDDLQARRRLAWVFAAQGAFLALRALIGPGLAGASSDGPPVWGALAVVETAAAVVAAAVLSLAMSRGRGADRPGGERLDDRLTGIGNRRALFRSGWTLIAGARAAGRPAALLVMGLDGVVVVDELLVAFARLAHAYLPPTSLVCRIGDATFAAVLAGAERDRALAVADEIRALFAHVVIAGPAGPLRGTVSIGIAWAAPTDGGMAEVLARADACLSAARTGGGASVTVEGDPVVPERATPPGRGRSAA